MTTETRQCEHAKSGNWRRYRTRCTHNAKVERGGHYYCGVHDPVRVAEKRAKRDAGWRANVRAEVSRAECTAKLIADAAGPEATREQLRELARLILESK